MPTTALGRCAAVATSGGTHARARADRAERDEHDGRHSDTYNATFVFITTIHLILDSNSVKQVKLDPYSLYLRIFAQVHVCKRQRVRWI